MADNNAKYLELITSEYSKKPLFNAFVKSFLDMLSPSVDNLDSFNTIFNIDNAEGDQLDKLGDVVGISRILPIDDADIPASLSDDTYRAVIKAKIAKNRWDGTIQGLADIVSLVFPDSGVQIQDNQDMTCYVNIFIPDYIDADEFLSLLSNGFLFPKPSGVQINYTIYQGYVFGWDYDYNVIPNPDSVDGWDRGRWLTN